MRKQIFIHIGIGKTGTSSIQHVLSEHRADLERQSFLYPTTGQRWEKYGCGHFDLTPLGVPGIQGALSGLYDRLDAELAECAASKVILSSELLSFALDGFIRDLANRLKEHDVRVVFYAREQCSLIESTFLWWQKVGNDYLGDIRSFYDVHQDSFDLLARVSPWARVFGHDRIMCRLYDRQLMGGNVVNDIAQALGIRLDAGSLVADLAPENRIPC